MGKTKNNQTRTKNIDSLFWFGFGLDENRDKPNHGHTLSITPKKNITCNHYQDKEDLL